jgi:organic hydroperoxide reductase OsmC/OhrA
MTAPERKIAFRADLSWDSRSGAQITLPKGSTISIDTPKEFGGEGRYPCPDELFFSAIGGCLITTFLYVHKKLEFNLRGLQVSVTGNVESIGTEGFRIKRVEAIMSVETDQEGKEKARECIDMTKKFCHITRSIEKSIPIDLSWKVIVKTDN